MFSIEVDHDRCILCQTCIKICPMGVYEVKGEALNPANIDDCIACRACEAACPIEAIVIQE